MQAFCAYNRHIAHIIKLYSINISRVSVISLSSVISVLCGAVHRSIGIFITFPSVSPTSPTAIHYRLPLSGLPPCARPCFSSVPLHGGDGSGTASITLTSALSASVSNCSTAHSPSFEKNYRSFVKNIRLRRGVHKPVYFRIILIELYFITYGQSPEVILYKILA